MPALESRVTQIFLSLSVVAPTFIYSAMLALYLLLILVSYITFALADRLLLRGEVSWEEGEGTNWEQENVNMHTTIASLGRQP